MNSNFLAPTAFGVNSCAPSGSSYNAKRKRQSWTSEDYDFEQAKHMRVQSPRLDRRSNFPLNGPPELIADNSNTNSDSEHDQDQNMDLDMDMDSDARAVDVEAASVRERNGEYSFGQGGSGGFGFGPGAEEDEEDDFGSASNTIYPQVKLYPSLTNHPNPHHFSNRPPKSPFSAQPFSATLRAPSPTIRGLLQPSTMTPLPISASEVDKARNQHGPHCGGIPKLRLSQFPDPVTGERSMWTVCESCGACERTA